MGFACTDCVIHHRRPDLILEKKDTRECPITDVDVPNDCRVTAKDIEKITRLWN